MFTLIVSSFAQRQSKLVTSFKSNCLIYMSSGPHYFAPRKDTTVLCVNTYVKYIYARDSLTSLHFNFEYIVKDHVLKSTINSWIKRRTEIGKKQHFFPAKPIWKGKHECKDFAPGKKSLQNVYMKDCEGYNKNMNRSRRWKHVMKAYWIMRRWRRRGNKRRRRRIKRRRGSKRRIIKRRIKREREEELREKKRSKRRIKRRRRNKRRTI